MLTYLLIRENKKLDNGHLKKQYALSFLVFVILLVPFATK